LDLTETKEKSQTKGLIILGTQFFKKLLCLITKINNPVFYGNITGIEATINRQAA